MASLKELMAARKQATAPAPVAAAPAGLVIKPAGAAVLPPRPPVEIPPPEVRELGNTKPEGGIPFEFPSATDSDAAKEWLRLLQLPETALGIWIEPGMEGAWLAIRNEANPKRPLLITRLKTLNVWNDEPF